MATGVGFSFDTSFLQNLEKADKKMEALMDKSNTLANSVVSAFSKMTHNGVAPFAKELEDRLNALNSIKIAIGDNAQGQFSKLKQSITGAIDEVHKLLEVLKNAPATNIDKQVEKSVNKEIEAEKNAYLKNLSDRIKAQQEYQQRMQYIAELQRGAEQKKEDERYQLWLMRKHSEAKEQKRIEDEKTQATIEAINKQNAAYAEQKRLSDTDEKRYNDWLKQKEREVQDHEDAERRKHNATMNVIALQNAAYAEQAKMVEKKRQEYAKLYAGLSPNDINYLLSSSHGVNPQIEFEQKQIKALTQAQFDLDKQDKNYVQTINSLNDAIARHKRNLQALTDVLREQQREYEKNAQANRQSQRQKNTSYEGALDFSSRAKSINREKLAIQYLTEARNNLSKADADYQNKLNTLNSRIKQHNKNIQEATAGAKDLQEKHRGLMDTSGQLARALAAVFSVSAIKGYVNKLMQIRGEFELQQRSLQILLQNKDEANALWDKTVSLAVKSPFTTKQLVTYTKQLAAYRVESEKLYETNKMLADVSAGLGVDMNRLILAFGQVKAANFLRGTELRQFSEAGVNMLDELAKRFTALEGRAVSVGEVFERVSKRMVSFADVEAVFKTITSEGGTFYQMQEKQSETLKGMMLNLKDSYELMLNDIGKDSEGQLKGFVSLMKTLVDNWRSLEPYIKTAGLTFVAYFSAKQLANLVSWFGKLTEAVRAFGVASAATTAINPWVALATVIGAVAAAIYSVVTATDEMTAAMLEVEKNATESLEESIALYHKLTDTINDSTNSLDERNQAYENLKTKFKDILPDQLTELKYIESLAFNYKAAEDAMFSYYNAKAIEQKKDKVEGLYEEDFATDEKDLILGLKGRIEESSKFSEEDKARLKAGVAGAVNSVVEDLKQGKIAANFQSVKEELDRRLFDFSGVKIDTTLKDYWGFGDDISKIHKNIKELIDSSKSYKEEMADINGLAFRNFEQEEAYEAQEAFKEEMNTATKYFKDLVALRQKIADNKIDLTTPDAELNEEQLSKREWYLNSIQNIYNALVQDVPQYANKIKELDNTLLDSANKGAYEYKLALGDIENKLFNVFAENAKSLSSVDEGAQAMLENFAENIKATADSKLATPLMEAITSAFNKAINDKDLSQKGKDLLAKLLPDSKQATEDVRKSVEALLKQYQDEVKKWENSKLTGGEQLPLIQYINQWGDEKFKSAMGMFLGSDEEFNELQQKVIPVLEHIDRLLGGDPNKDKKGGGRDIFAERLRVIKEIYQAYKDLSKTLDDVGAKEGAMQKFGNAFKEAFGKTPEQMGFDLFSEEGVKKAYDYLIKNAPNAKKKIQAELAKGEIVLETKVRLQQEEDKNFADQIADMFSGYELSLELQKLNIPQDLAQQLFGVETFDLSQIREKLEKEIADAEKQGGREDFVAERKKELEKVEEMERKAQEERLKRYSQFLIKGYNERINLKLQELRELELLEKDKEKLTPQQYEAAKKGIQDEYRNKALQQQWKDFEQSSQYINLFDDIENASTASLQNMKSKLDELKQSMIASGLPARDLKEILDQINKVEEELENRAPFKTFINDVKTAVGGIKEQIELRKEEKRLNEEINRLEKQKPTDEQVAEEKHNAKNNPQYQQLLSAQKLLGTLKEGTHEYEQQKALVGKLEKDVYPLTTAHNEITEDLKEQNKKLEENQGKQKSWVEAVAGVREGFSDAADFFNGMSSSVGTLISDLENGIGISDSMKDNLELIQGVMGGMGQISSGVAGLMSGNPLSMIQGGMNVLGGISNIIGSFNAKHDKKKERQIEREMKLVEKLQKVYEDLGETIEKTYSLDTLNEATKMSKQNLEEQIRATERMIEAEKGKKDTDWERIEKWKEQIEEYKETMKELEETRLQELGAFASDENKKSGAQAFMDAWFEAYKETGVGLSGLNEQFDEFFEDMIKKQMLSRGANKFLEPFFREFDNNIEKWADGQISEKEALANIEEAKNLWMPRLDEFWESMAETFGVAEDLAGKNAELGGLQAGIQGITEDQADVLASYWSSVRLYTADTNTKVTELVTKLFSDDTTTNPMLSQLLTIAEQTRAIRDMFDSVIGRGGNNKHAGAYLKVDIG